MTNYQARQILGVSDSADLAEIEKVYSEKIAALHLKNRPGNSVDIRKKAEAEITSLTSAYETLQELGRFNFNYANPNFNRQPGQQSANPNQNPQGANPVPGNSANRRVFQIIVIAVSALFFLIVAALLIRANDNYKQRRMAFLRVVCVPWCYVQLDDKYLGTSGGAQPFKVTQGRYKLILYRDDMVIRTTLDIKAQTTKTVKAQIEKGEIYVSP